MTLEAWDQTIRPLAEKSVLIVVCAVLFILVFTFGLLSLVVGAVVTKTLEQKDMMVSLHKEEQLKALKLELVAVEAVFLASDTDGSGTISRDELQQAMHDNPFVTDTFVKYGIQRGDAMELFGVLDWNSTGGITIDDFIEGIGKVYDNQVHVMDTLATHANIRSVQETFGHGWNDRGLKHRVLSIEQTLNSRSERLDSQKVMLLEIVSQLNAVCTAVD